MLEKDINRRAGPDKLVKLNTAISNLSWVFISLVVLFSWVLVFVMFLFTRVVNDPLRGLLNQPSALPSGRDAAAKLVSFSFIALLILFAISGIGLILNSLRHHRKTDKYNVSLIILLILSLIGLISRFIFL